MKTISFEGKRHLGVALRGRQESQAQAYSVAPFTLPVLVVALVAPGRSLSAEGGTRRRGGASALALIWWLEGAKGKVSGDSCEPHPFPTWLRRPGEEHRACRWRSGEWAPRGRGGGVCTTLGDLVWGKERIVPKILGKQMLRLSCRAGSLIHFIHSCCAFVHLSTCYGVGCILGSGARSTGGSR